MKDCSPSVAPIMKGNKLSLNQRPKNDLEKESIKNIPYALAIESLMYARFVQDLIFHMQLECYGDIKVIQV